MSEDIPVVPYPDWPNPGIGEFSKCIGSIEYRRKGGINNWIGESKICSAKKCIKIDKWLTFVNAQTYKSNLLFRRFYFDGMASGKFEVGFEMENLTNENLKLEKIIEDIADLNVRIGIIEKEDFQLGNADKGLCQLYQIATRKINSTYSQDFIYCSKPVIILRKLQQENFIINLNGFRTVVNDLKIEVGFYSLTQSRNLNEVWIINDLNRWETISYERGEKIRQLRITLARIISLKKSLNKILKLIQAEKISPKQRSDESNNLQHFLIDSIRRLYRESEKVSDESIIFLFKNIERDIFPGEAESLYAKLKNVINVRPQILDKVIEFLDPKDRNNTNINNISIMTNNIDNSGAKNTNMNFGSGKANQNISENNFMNNEDLLLVHKKIFEIENHLLQIENDLKKEEFDKLKNQKNQIKETLNEGNVSKKTIKDKFDYILSTAKKLGDIAVPITKIAGEVSKYLYVFIAQIRT
ncbi:hypothetical protein [Salegentibacter mishustinae]|uniref:hypothetical protein n=1 Tax=Salegentibacter mishustinae TaxID=270918 RepID=UPI00249049E0|nr:hypothetical protein [Salegentibacter mishustinae]